MTSKCSFIGSPVVRFSSLVGVWTYLIDIKAVFLCVFFFNKKAPVKPQTLEDFEENVAIKWQQCLCQFESNKNMFIHKKKKVNNTFHLSGSLHFNVF